MNFKAKIGFIFLGVILAILIFGGIVVRASTVLFPSGGGTGTSTNPTYGKILVGNASGTYTLTSTSSLGIGVGGSLTKGFFIVGNDAGAEQATSSIFISSLGTIGIGTTNPSRSSLEIQATSTAATSHPLTIWDSSASNLFDISGNGNVGIGTSSPFAQLSVHANNGSTNTMLFAIGSSTPTATTTLFTVNNQGNAVVAGSINAGNFITAGNIFDTAGAYRLTVTGGGVRYGADSPGDGLALIQNRTSTGLSRLEFGGSTSGFPSLTFNTGTQAVNVNLADGSLGGRFGVGTTTPFSKFAIHADNGETNTTLFAIASSTATATTTLFSISNTGVVNIGTSTPDIPLANMTIDVGAKHGIAFGRDASFATVPAISMNGSFSDSGMSGFFADQSGNGNFYINTPTSILLRPGGTGSNTQFRVTAGGLLIGAGNSTGVTTQAANPLDVTGGAAIGFANAFAAPTNGLIVAGTSGFGTSSPFAQFSIATPNGSNGSLSTLFAIASSTQAGATTTPWGISNSGWVVTSGNKPTAGTCGSTQVIDGNQTSGNITFTGTLVTSCQINFVTPVPAGTTLQCTDSDNSLTGFADIAATTTSSVTFGLSAGLSAGTIWWNCGATRNANN